jgi:signal transduction histidine kinase/DNA-binding response OmpR family regulator
MQVDRKKDKYISPENSGAYKFANIIGQLGLILYAILRLSEAAFTEKSFATALKTAVLCCVCLLLLALLQKIVRYDEKLPLITGLVISGFFIGGAIYTKEFDYFYISLLCTCGIVCMYQNFRMLMIFFLIELPANILLFILIFRNADYVDYDTMVVSAMLCFYGFFFLAFLSHHSSERESIAQAGLHSFYSLLTTTPNMLVIVDENKIVKYLSKPMAELAEIDQELAINRPLLDLFRDRELKLMFADIMDSDGFYSEVKKISVDGNEKYFKVVCDSLRGEVKGLFLDISDITSTVESKNHAELAMKEAKKANESKSRFLATMSHEIRTPMNAIIGISQMLLSNVNISPEIGNQIDKIYSSGHNLLGIINDILDLSKIETGKLEILPDKYDLPSLINDSVQLNIYRIGSKPINFTLNVDENTPAELFGDELRIKQILNNILSNAFKYTEKGTVSMDITAENIDAAANDTDSTDSTNSTDNKEIYIIFSISDTGQGMKPEDVNSIFKEYSRFNTEANRATEGTGLGMNITKKLVEMMDGNISIESEYGKGSTFTVRIRQQIIGEGKIGKEMSEQLRNFTFYREKQFLNFQICKEYMPYGKVLVVDDVETNLFVAEGLMNSYGIQITLLNSGTAALEDIRKGSIYDIIFMDHMMPKMDGLECTKLIRKLGYTEPIIALTANAISGNREMFIANGFDDFISKPIDLRVLNEVLNKYIKDKYKYENSAVNIIPPPVLENQNHISKKLIEVFTKDAQHTCDVLNETFEKEDWKLFAISAHGIKSACANVGNYKLSEEAKELEFAAKETENYENIKLINEKLPLFLSELKTFCEKLSPSVNVDTKNITGINDSKELKNKLIEIALACDNFDEITAEPIIEEILKFKLPDSVRTKISELSNLVMFSEFSEAAEKCTEIIRGIE